MDAPRSGRDYMLLLLIALAWITVTAFFVILCRVAARGDSAQLRMPAHAQGQGQAQAHPLMRGLVVWDEPTLTSGPRRRHSAAGVRRISRGEHGRATHRMARS